MGAGATIISSSSSSSSTFTFFSLISSPNATQSLSPYDEYFPPEHLHLYRTICDLYSHFLAHDTSQIHQQRGKLLKDHKLIIQSLCDKDSLYLQQFHDYYSHHAHGNSSLNPKYSSIFHEDIMKICHGTYGEFLYQITRPSYESINSIIETCFTKYSANELDLGDLLCLCNSYEFLELKRIFPLTRDNKLTLKDLIQSKSIENLPFWEFMELLMIVNRRHDLETDHQENVIVKYANELYKAGLGNDQSEQNNEKILSILAVISRKQCQLISEMYEKLFQMSLTDAINATFAASAQRALLIWTLPHVEALTHCFHRLILADDQDCHKYLLSLLARSQRDDLQQVISRLQSEYHINFMNYLQKIFKGNLYLSIETWCNPTSYDRCGYQKIINFISALSHEDRDQALYSISQDPKLLEEFHELLCLQMNTLMTYAKKHSISLPSYDMTKFVFTGVIISPVKNATPSGHQYFDTLKECLEDQFILLDSELNDSLDEMLVWNYLISLHIGYNIDDIPSLRESTGWVSAENTIPYHDLLSDITRHVLWTIESSELNVELTIQAMWKFFENQAEEQWNSCGYYGQFDGVETGDETLPPDLVAFLNSKLPIREVYSNEEFWRKVHELISLPAAEFESAKELWDTNQTDTSVNSWEDAISQLQYLFTQIEYDESSNWIYLYDNSTKRLYWYNLQDNSSSWMSHADQEYYLSQSAGMATEGDTAAMKQRNKTIVAKVRRTSVLQAAQYRRMTTQELKDSLSQEEQ